ncbi:MAG: hypothetical protein OXH51_00590 [Gemmatimonadetes bacterium]|nr:hypothetical protein [Gemmatimonadota bacterium]MCY3610021.1 hypothetical protein [Gemmatimonadota bacterium]
MTPASAPRTTAHSEETRRQHRDAWLIVLAVGCAIILFGNLLGIGAWWLASAVAMCMVIYGIGIQVYIEDSDVPGDIKGDSIYYLGLLFTFAALVAALITFDWGTPGTDGSGTTGSIRNFGIALLTTIVGLAGRVWFTMSQESPGDIVDTARSELEETVSLMKESLDRARDDLDIMANKFRDSSVGLAKTAATIADSTKRTAATYEALDAYTGQVAGTAESLTHQMDQLKGVCGLCSSALLALQETARELGTRLDEVPVRLGDHFDRAQAQLKKAEATFDGINRVAGPAAERVADTLRGVEGTAAAASALGRSLSGMRGSAEQARKALAGIADAVDGQEALPLWKESVDQLHEGTRGVRGIARRAAEMNAEFEELSASLRAARDGLASVPSTARSINEQLGAELDDAVQRARDLSHEVLHAARANARADVWTEPAQKPRGRIRQTWAGTRRALARTLRAWKRLTAFRRQH